jgi:hypothetical protein
LALIDEALSYVTLTKENEQMTSRRFAIIMRSIQNLTISTVYLIALSLTWQQSKKYRRDS